MCIEDIFNAKFSLVLPFDMIDIILAATHEPLSIPNFVDLEFAVFLNRKLQLQGRVKFFDKNEISSFATP